VKRRTLFLVVLVLALLAVVYLALFVADDCQSRWSAISEALSTELGNDRGVPATEIEGRSRLS
jgi:hypothetical protein